MKKVSSWGFALVVASCGEHAWLVCQAYQVTKMSLTLLAPKRFKQL